MFKNIQIYKKELAKKSEIFNLIYMLFKCKIVVQNKVITYYNY